VLPNQLCFLHARIDFESPANFSVTIFASGNNLVISVTGYEGRVIATDKETGKVVWDKNLLDQADLELTAAPLALKDAILIGGSGGDRGLRNWVAALDPKTGDIVWKTYSIPAAGEPGSETWKNPNS